MTKKRINPAFMILLCIINSTVIHAEFMRGADISTQTQQDTDGVKYNEEGVQKDVLTIFKNHDFNWIRIRLFHTPSGSVQGVFQDLAYVTTLAQRVKAEGFKFLLDIHYSDTWADPGQQAIPAAWSGYTHAQLVTAVHDYTRDVIIHLRTNGVMPEMVQIGNEITNGMLWPDGQLYGGSSSWSNFVDLINAGISGVNDGRGTEPMPKIMLHIDRGGDWGGTQWFLDNIISRGVVFDVLGQSFYPEWHGTLDDLENCLNNTAANYPYEIVMAEVGDYYTGSTGKTPESQKAFLEGVFQLVQAAPNGLGTGIFYWEPTWVWNSGSGYRALFQPISGDWRNVNMLPGMEAFDIPSTDFTPPAAPTGLSATAQTAAISLDWNDNTEEDLDGYNVYRSTTSGNGYTKLNSYLITGSSYIDSTASIGSTYYYVVTAVDTSDNESDNSGEVTASPSGSVAVYTFTGITAANTDYNAYACDVDTFPFDGNSGNRNTIVEADDTQYANISSVDTGEWTTADPGLNDEIFLWIEMKVNELPAEIGRINLTFNGYTGGSNAAIYRIFVLTAGADWTQTASWTQLGADQSISSGTYAAMTRSITSNFSNYIDADGKITWAVHETTSSEMMHINFLQMAVSYAYLSPCCLDLSDFADFARQWSRDDCDTSNAWCEGMDRSRDGDVVLDDLLVFVQAWLAGSE